MVNSEVPVRKGERSSSWVFLLFDGVLAWVVEQNCFLGKADMTENLSRRAEKRVGVTRLKRARERMTDVSLFTPQSE